MGVNYLAVFLVGFVATWIFDAHFVIRLKREVDM